MSSSNRFKNFAQFEKVLGKDSNKQVFRYRWAELYLKAVSMDFVFACLMSLIEVGIILLQTFRNYKISDGMFWFLSFMFFVSWLIIVYKKGATLLIEALADRTRGSNQALADIDSVDSSSSSAPTSEKTTVETSAVETTTKTNG